MAKRFNWTAFRQDLAALVLSGCWPKGENIEARTWHWTNKR